MVESNPLYDFIQAVKDSDGSIIINIFNDSRFKNWNELCIYPSKWENTRVEGVIYKQTKSTAKSIRFAKYFHKVHRDIIKACSFYILSFPNYITDNF